MSKPKGFDAAAKACEEEAATFFAIEMKNRKQERFEFDDSRMMTGKNLGRLRKQFNGKCAYCKSTPAEQVDRFRPRGGEAESSGSYLGDHYWRQAYTWENLYLCCPLCSRYKGNRFPVEGKRASAGSNRSELTEEQALLLGPCEDDPVEHLVFSADGRVSGKTEKGRVSIEVFGLNRPDLLRETSSGT